MRRMHSKFRTVVVLWISKYCGKYRVSPRIVWSMGKYGNRLNERGERANERNEL